jgi:8-oxo-dGTP diphosphatase
MVTPIAIAVVEHEGRFLIGQRPEGVPLAGYWEFPGGKIEPGETAEAAAVRECLEETGLAVQAVSRYPTHSEHYEHGAFELHFIACRPALPEFTLNGRFHWVERSDLADYEFPAGNRMIIAALME